MRKTMEPVGPIQFIYRAGTRCVSPKLRMQRALPARDEGGICTDTFSEIVGFESRSARHEFVRDSVTIRRFHESPYVIQPFLSRKFPFSIRSKPPKQFGKRPDRWNSMGIFFSQRCGRTYGINLVT